MDSSSIGAVAAVAQGRVAQAAAQPANDGKTSQTSAAAASTKGVKADQAADVRTRDSRSLQYQVDGSTKQVVATIVDDSNQTVVVQIPSEEVLRIAKAIDRMKGFLLEGKA